MKIQSMINDLEENLYLHRETKKSFFGEKRNKILRY